MPADYLSRLPSANTDKRAKITECFDPFLPDLRALQKADKSLQNMNHFQIHGQWPKGLPKSEANYLQNLAHKLFQDANNLFGFGWTITNIHERHFTDQKNTENWLYARHIIINLGATMQYSKRTFKFLPHTTGLRCTKTF